MIEKLIEILNSSLLFRSDINPSEWNEKNRILKSENTPFPGPFNYERTPYLREIVDCCSPNHPAKTIAVMKGAQIGFSTGVIESAIGYIISEEPGNILFLTGHSDLSEEAMNKIDQLIDGAGLRSLIRPNVNRSRNNKTGDTNKRKEFPGGSLISGSATNHKLLMQRSVRYAFIDDYDAAKKSSKTDGSTESLIEQRLAAYYGKMKLYYISTPRLKQTSNIEPVYLLGDQRKFYIPCPCCGDFIFLDWIVDIEGTEGKEKGGITWKIDNKGKLVKGSVGYICQSCSGFFNDSNKKEFNLNGVWKPTMEPSREGYYSYHISSLYAPPGMYDWEYYVRQYIKACPVGEKRNEELYKTFVNLCLGETYEQQGKTIQANELQKNIRNYDIDTLPEKMSIKDGNGKIVLITCAADLNGTEEDARLDYEVVAWTETGSSYSIRHGSIGTFIPREGAKKYKTDRERWTYTHNKSNSVWPELDKVLSTVFKTDTGRKMKIFITGIDCGHHTHFAYQYIDKSNFYVVGVKGKENDKYIKFGVDVPNVKHAKERGKLFLVEVNQVKDQLANQIELKWDSGNDISQPAGFMNYPTPSSGLYLFNNFFSHYESEHREVESKDGQGIGIRWVKKRTTSQNHFWDVRVYNLAVRDIWVSEITKQMKIQKGTWSDYVDIALGRLK